MVQPMTKLIYGLSRAMAWLGSIVLTLLALMTVASVVGRALTGIGLGPVPGDFELVEVGTALAVFCFMPWCHLKRGHAMVDMFWRAYPPAMQRVLMVLADGLMFVVWVLLIWRMGLSMLDYRGNEETTFILHMPVWWGYAASMPPAVVGCLAYGWRLLESLGLAQPPKGFETTAAVH